MFLFLLKESRNVEKDRKLLCFFFFCKEKKSCSLGFFFFSKHVLGSHPHGPVPPLHTMSNQGDCCSLTESYHWEKAFLDRPVQGCFNRIFAIIMDNQ